MMYGDYYMWQGDYDEDESESSLDDEEDFNDDLRRVKRNDQSFQTIIWSNEFPFLENIRPEKWEEIGRDISNNTSLKHVTISDGFLVDEDNMTSLFRGLTKSTSIQMMNFSSNEMFSEGLRRMMPFLQNASKLHTLNLDSNIIGSEGFHILLRGLSDTIQFLRCENCLIEEIEQDIDYFPKALNTLHLSNNEINSDCCRGIANLLRGGAPALTHLYLRGNLINDEGVAILVDALKTNTSLTHLDLSENKQMSEQGKIMLMKLVIDVSSPKATLDSNHTLVRVDVSLDYMTDIKIDMHISKATTINAGNANNLEAAKREKMLQLQLHSEIRQQYAKFQGVSHSLYSQIDPLYLPEVFSLVGRKYGLRELLAALKTSLNDGLLSVVDKKKCIKEKLAYHLAIADKLRAELAELDASEERAVSSGNEQGCSQKRRRCMQ